VKALIALLVICTAVATSAAPPFSGVRGGYVALSVADLDASAAWYADTLDLKIVREHSQSPDKKSVATVLMGNGLIVELIHHVEAMPLNSAAPTLTRTFQIHGIFKWGVVVDDLDAALKELEARHVNIAFRILSDDGLAYRTFAIRDNAANIIQFFGK
jgi:catechol 2,3-dioxygenase-like lactoylglutathione lyase family enzyme